RFDFLGGMWAITAAPELGRWYFHFATQSQFGTGEEVSGFADATFNFQRRTQAVSIVSQPRGKTAVAGTTAEFQVIATGYPLEFQWFHDGTPIQGETGFRLRLAGVQPSDAGRYSVTVSNV